MNATVRNVLIILALAAAVAFLPAAGIAANLIGWLFGTLFLVALAWFAAVLYRRFQADLLGLEDRTRLILYGSIGVGFVTLTATDRMWNSGAGSIAWIALLLASGYGIYRAFLAYRAY